MNRIAVLLLAALLAASDFDAAIAQRLADSALHGRSAEYARRLTATVGPRVTGTAGYRNAVSWALDELRAAGASSARTERFTMARGWERAARGSASIVSPVTEPLTLESMGWAPSTPGRGIEAEVVRSGDDVAGSGRVRGRIVLLDGGAPRDLDRRLKDAGALAILFPDDDPDGALAARVRAFGGDIALLPSAVVAHRDVQRLNDLIARGPVRIAMSLNNTVSDGPIAVDTVLADIAGREKPDEVVLVGAHLDSWDFAVGAQDNATGVAMVIEAARSIAALGRPPRRTIRFALWGGEEEGLLGSAAYVAAHARDLDRHVAALNADAGTGRIIGWTTPGRQDVMAAAQTLSNALLAGLHADTVDRSMRYAFDSDIGPFVRLGIPSFDLNADDAAYEEIHHKVTDTMERVNVANLATGAAVVAVTAYAIADAPGRIAPRGRRLRN